MNAGTIQTPASFAQHGEDLIVWEYFGGKANGFFIEVGANDPVELSQTWFLEQRGWRGMLVEALPHCCEKLRGARPGSIVCQTAVSAPDQVGETTFYVAKADAWSKMTPPENPADTGAVIRVPVNTLESLCRQHQAPAIDFLSIDVEGMELQVLKGFDLRARRPALILLEDHLMTIDLVLYMYQAGYRLAKRTGCNNWWIPRGAPPLPQTFREKVRLWNRVLFRNPWPKLLRLLSGPK